MNVPSSQIVQPVRARHVETQRIGGEDYADAGVVYLCYGRSDFFAETQQSIRSLRGCMPDVQITVYTDQPDCFTSMAVDVRPLEWGSHDLLRQAPFYVKPLNLRDSPYRRTLYLDGDTYVVLPFWELFDALARFDVAGCIEGSLASQEAFVDARDNALGLSFPEWNLGVLGFRRSDVLAALFADWLREYERLYLSPTRRSILSWNDQIPFRVAAWNSTARLLTLPNNFNAKIGPFEVSTVQSEVKILHGRHPAPGQIAEQINRRMIRRVVSGTRCVPLLSVARGNVSHQTFFTQDASPEERTESSSPVEAAGDNSPIQVLGE